jgi:hypothetical protein
MKNNENFYVFMRASVGFAPYLLEKAASSFKASKIAGDWQEENRSLRLK